MMTNTKWLRRALLGGVALSVMAAGAQADELSDLKSQLEALQLRVNQLEQQPQRPALPEGATFLTVSRGMAEMLNYGTEAARDALPAERGFTLAVTPTADLPVPVPVPVTEVVVYGYVKGDVIVDFDGDLGQTFRVSSVFRSSGGDDEHLHWRLQAKQSLFGIDSRTDTAIGKIRTKLEGDFFTGGDSFRLRHGWGAWEMEPNWTLLIGQTLRTAILLPIGVRTVDFAGSAGAWGFPRVPQARLTYRAGPIAWAVAAEAPSHVSDAEWPDFSGYLTYSIPGGHLLIVSGMIADGEEGVVLYDPRTDEHRRLGDDDFGWVVAAGANIKLADIATFTIGGAYGEDGPQCLLMTQEFGCQSAIDADKERIPNPAFLPDLPIIPGVNEPTIGTPDFFADEGWGIVAGLNVPINETTSANVQYGITVLDNAFLDRVADDLTIQTVHGNILWQPVRQMRLGWEVMWGRYDFDGGESFVGDESGDAIRGQFAAWFYF
jgi:hypothetical protein